MTMIVRTATALIVALMAAACGFTEEMHKAASESVGESASAGPHTDASHVGDANGDEFHVTLHHWGDTLEEVAATQELTVLVRATDAAWTASAPGSTPPDGWSDQDQDLPEPLAYHWREFDVVEVVSGSYEHETLNYGNLFDRTLAGETYLLIISVLKNSESWETQGPEDWPPRYSDQHFTGPAPPYLLTADNILTSTDPTLYPQLDESLTLSDARARLGETDSQDRETEPLELPTPLPSLGEEQDD